MSDIVERLKRVTLYAGHGELSDLPEEAADEITRLRAEVERLRAVLEIFACDCEGDAVCLGNCYHKRARTALGDTHERE